MTDKRYQTLQEVRAKLNNNFSYQTLPMGSLVFRIVHELHMNQLTISIKNCLRLLMYCCAIKSDPDLHTKVAVHGQGPFCFVTWHRPGHHRMWDSYRNELGLKDNSVLMYEESRYLPRNPFVVFSHRQLKRDIISVVTSGRNSSWFERSLMWAYVGYVCSMVDYVLPALQHITFDSLYVDGDPHLPGAIVTEYANTRDIPTHSFQFYSITGSQDIKMPLAVTWLNASAKTMYVWGPATKDYINSVNPSIECRYISHPDYRALQEYTFLTDHNSLVIAPNPHDVFSSFNKDLFDLVDRYCEQHNDVRIYIKLHPVDSPSNVQEFIYGKPWFAGYVDDLSLGAVYIVGETSLYFDLVAAGKLVLRYDHPSGFQMLTVDVADSFSDSSELEHILRTTNPEELQKKYQAVMKHYFNVI